MNRLCKLLNTNVRYYNFNIGLVLSLRFITFNNYIFNMLTQIIMHTVRQIVCLITKLNNIS